MLGFLRLDLWEPQIDSSKSEVPQTFLPFLFIISVIITALRENRKLEKVLRKRRN